MGRSLHEEPMVSPACRWTVWLLFAAAWSAALLTPEPSRVAAVVLPEETIFSTSKLLHLSAYAVWTVLSAWLALPPRRRWLVLLILSAHAFATEYLQQFVPGRGPSWLDVGIDHVGIAVGLALTWRRWKG